VLTAASAIRRDQRHLERTALESFLSPTGLRKQNTPKLIADCQIAERPQEVADFRVPLRDCIVLFLIARTQAIEGPSETRNVEAGQYGRSREVGRRAGDEDAVEPLHTAAFDEDGSWRRLSGRLRGYVHTDLLVRSRFRRSFYCLSSGNQNSTMQSERTRKSRLPAVAPHLAVSNQSLGVFCFRSQLEKEMIQGSPFQMPADLSGWRMRQ